MTTNTILVTAGGTWEPVDAVRMLGNRSTGATGMAIARAAHERGWRVSLLLSEHSPISGPWAFEVERFSSHFDLEQQMQARIGAKGPDAIVHAAAVADYQVVAVYRGEGIGPQSGSKAGSEIPSGVKIPGGLDSLWLKLAPLPKILAKIRKDWKFPGVLVSFKLEQGAGLLARARENLISSGSDLVVANTWADHTHEAYLVLADRHLKGGAHFTGELNAIEAVQKIPREELPERMMNFLESCPKP